MGIRHVEGPEGPGGICRVGQTNSEARICQNVWVAVIWRALLDAAWIGSYTIPKARDSTKERMFRASREARIWLRGTTKDFSEVCHLAGISPGYVKIMAGRVMNKPDSVNMDALRLGVS